jgi:hypothetical protein
VGFIEQFTVWQLSSSEHVNSAAANKPEVTVFGTLTLEVIRAGDKGLKRGFYSKP